MDDIHKLIEFYKYPEATCRSYHGDVTDDTIQALEELAALREQHDDLQPTLREAFGQFPDEDELSGITCELNDLLKPGVSKAFMVARIKEVLVMIDEKQMQLNGQTEHALDITRGLCDDA